MSKLFTPLTLRGVTFPNRVWMSPMCQYSAIDGVPNDWHHVHYVTRAIGGVGLVMAEATGVSPEGRISPQDLGLWNDEQLDAFTRINHEVHSYGAKAGVQLAHAGRKASTYRGFENEPMGTVPASDGGWPTLAPSAIAFDDYAAPSAMIDEDIDKVKADFVAAAERALEANFDVIELHAAHGYLLHQFLSPLSNQRTDDYGGSFENRVRLLLDVVDLTRVAWGDERPIVVRLSATDWMEGSWDLEQSVRLSVLLREHGVDLVDVSSGGLVPNAKIEVGLGYQVPFASRIRAEADIAVGAVGMITDFDQAEAILHDEHADAVFLARALLWNPYWANHAAMHFGDEPRVPAQYARGIPRH